MSPTWPFPSPVVYFVCGLIVNVSNKPFDYQNIADRGWGLKHLPNGDASPTTSTLGSASTDPKGIMTQIRRGFHENEASCRHVTSTPSGL
jgi:hypothetical protein